MPENEPKDAEIENTKKGEKEGVDIYAILQQDIAERAVAFSQGYRKLCEACGMEIRGRKFLTEDGRVAVENTIWDNKSKTYVKVN